VEIENVMRSATVDIRANPAVFFACPKSIAHCSKENASKDEKGNVVEDGGMIEGKMNNET
jgi:hypothetical protein